LQKQFVDGVKRLL